MVDFAVHAGLLVADDIKIVAASVDTVEQVNDLKAGLRVEFPMYAELDAPAVAEATGAFIQTGDRTFMQATGFLLTPDGKVGSAVYATGPIGRLTPTEIVRAVRFARAAAAG